MSAKRPINFNAMEFYSYQMSHFEGDYEPECLSWYRARFMKRFLFLQDAKPDDYDARPNDRPK